MNRWKKYIEPVLLTLLFSSLILVSSGQDEKKAESLFKQAQILLQQDRFEEARQAFNYLIEKYPESTYAAKSQEYVSKNALLKVEPILNNGPARNRVNIAIMADGFQYKDTQQQYFSKIARQMDREFFAEPTYAEYAGYFNVYKVNIASKDGKVDDGVTDYDTALGGGRSGGITTVDHGRVTSYYPKFPFRADLTWVVLSGGGSGSTGGGGVVATFGSGLLVHESGHALVNLTDEYTQPLYGPNPPIVRGTNLSDTPDPKKVPWAHWLADANIAQLLKIGVYEGGHGREKGQWRPTPGGCTMDSGAGLYCPVCREQVVLAIYQRVNPIDERAPNDEPIKLRVTKTKSAESSKPEEASYGFIKPKQPPCWVMPVQPSIHKLQIKWYLKKSSSQESGWRELLALNEQNADKTNPTFPATRCHVTLNLVGKKLPSLRYRYSAKRVAEYPDLSKGSLAPGYYILTVQVKDEPYSLIQGIKVPWVLKDETNLLEERVAYALEVTAEEGANK